MVGTVVRSAWRGRGADGSGLQGPSGATRVLAPVALADLGFGDASLQVLRSPLHLPHF